MLKLPSVLYSDKYIRCSFRSKWPAPGGRSGITRNCSRRACWTANSWICRLRLGLEGSTPGLWSQHFPLYPSRLRYPRLRKCSYSFFEVLEISSVAWLTHLWVACGVKEQVFPLTYVLCSCVTTTSGAYGCKPVSHAIGFELPLPVASLRSRFP